MEKMNSKDSSLKCTRFSQRTFESFIDGSMDMEEMGSFVEHCESCSVCMSAFTDYQENLRLFERASNVMDRLEQQEAYVPDKENFFEVVLGRVKSILEVISTTGQIVSLEPSAMVTRGAEDVKISDVVQVLKVFEYPSLSVQLTFVDNPAGDGIQAILSLFDQERDTFLVNANVVILGSMGEESLTTDKDGVVIFYLYDTGRFQVMIDYGEKCKTELAITVQE